MLEWLYYWYVTTITNDNIQKMLLKNFKKYGIKSRFYTKDGITFIVSVPFWQVNIAHVVYDLTITELYPLYYKNIDSTFTKFSLRSEK